MGQESDQLNMYFPLNRFFHCFCFSALVESCLFNHASNLQHFEPRYLCSALPYLLVGDNVGGDLTLYLVVRE